MHFFTALNARYINNYNEDDKFTDIVYALIESLIKSSTCRAPDAHLQFFYLFRIQYQRNKSETILFSKEGM